jgi:hypothetical protein
MSENLETMRDTEIHVKISPDLKPVGEASPKSEQRPEVSSGEWMDELTAELCLSLESEAACLRSGLPSVAEGWHRRATKIRNKIAERSRSSIAVLSDGGQEAK